MALMRSTDRKDNTSSMPNRKPIVAISGCPAASPAASLSQLHRPTSHVVVDRAKEAVMKIRSLLSAVTVATLFALSSSPAQAQSIGTFTWQLQPYCNRVTLTITQNGGIYTLDGFDDQCGALQRAPLVGIATPNPDGTIGFGLHIVTIPGGRAVHVEARIDLVSLGGPWTDSAGNSGALVLNGNAAGAARPAPTVSGTVIAPGSVPATAIANEAVTQSKLADGAVSAQKLAPNAQPAGAAYTPASPNTVFATVPVDASVGLTITLNAPAAGHVIVNTSYYVLFNSAAVEVDCRITQTAALEGLRLRIQGTNAGDADRVPVAGTRGFAVAAGPQTFNLVCRAVSGTAAIFDGVLTAIYVPQLY
jgi:hypothetical protein